MISFDVWNYHHTQDSEHIHHFHKSSCAGLWSLSPAQLCFPLGNQQSAFCYYRLDYIFLAFYMNWIIKFVLFFFLDFFTRYIYFEIYPFCCMHVILVHSFLMLRRILLYRYVTICLSTCLLMDISVISSLGLL